MTPDWSAKAEPVPYAKLGNPQSLNLYSYVLNNPVSSVDSDGHWPLYFCIGCLNELERAYNKWINAHHPLPSPPAPLPEKAPPVPHMQYSQSTGNMLMKLGNNTLSYVGTGYSGRGKGLNNPDYQNVSERQDKKNAGPIQRGRYLIGRPTHAIGPVSMQLFPLQKQSRDGFFIHDDNPNKPPHNSSEGCPVLDRPAREQIARSGILDLTVVR